MKTHKMLLPIWVLLFLLCVGKWALSEQQTLPISPRVLSPSLIVNLKKKAMEISMAFP